MYHTMVHTMVCIYDRRRQQNTGHMCIFYKHHLHIYRYSYSIYCPSLGSHSPLHEAKSIYSYHHHYLQCSLLEDHYSGPCSLRPPIQPEQYSLKTEGGLKMEGYLY